MSGETTDEAVDGVSCVCRKASGQRRCGCVVYFFNFGAFVASLVISKIPSSRQNNVSTCR